MKSLKSPSPSLHQRTKKNANLILNLRMKMTKVKSRKTKLHYQQMAKKLRSLICISYLECHSGKKMVSKAVYLTSIWTV